MNFVIMKTLEEMSDRELQELSVVIQIQMMRKIDRIDRHLMRQGDINAYMSENEHLDKVYNDVYSEYESFLRQFRTIRNVD